METLFLIAIVLFSNIVADATLPKENLASYNNVECTKLHKQSISHELAAIRKGIDTERMVQYLRDDLKICNLTLEDIGSSEAELEKTNTFQLSKN